MNKEPVEMSLNEYERMVLIRSTIATSLICLLSWFFLGWSFGSKDNIISIVLLGLAALVSTIVLIILIQNIHELISNKS